MHVWKICFVFMAWALRWLLLCNASSASLYFLKGELRHSILSGYITYQRFAKWLRRTEVQGNPNSL